MDLVVLVAHPGNDALPQIRSADLHMIVERIIKRTINITVKDLDDSAGFPVVMNWRVVLAWPDL